MANKSAGFQWLKERYHLPHSLTHCSYIGNNESIELTSKGNIEQVYGPRYRPERDEPLQHLEFALKYDDFNLDFLKAVSKRISRDEIQRFTLESPAGRYARKIGFLYEWLTGEEIDLPQPTAGNYVDLLEPEKYITGNIVKNRKWRVNDNLPGSPEFCPMIRRTPALEKLLQVNVQERIQQLKDDFPLEIFTRAISYLYKKETRSSFEIEKETPSADRMERFISLLSQAGTEQTEEMMNEQRLIRLQNAIVDPRFAATGFRDFQNYVGELLPNQHDLIHYICPPPEIAGSLMNGLKVSAIKTFPVTPAEIRAALLSFGLVFIHPFEDGNGRLHRFLIHDILVHDGLVPSGLIIPVSAHMLNNIRDYDQILERYSRPLMERARFSKNDNGEIVMTNPDEVEAYYRYPDLTAQSVYLLETIHATLDQDMPSEIIFLQRYDEAKRALQQIVDMPDRDINSMLIFLHQNKGIFPKRRRERFSRLTDEEIARMGNVYRAIFELDQD